MSSTKQTGTEMKIIRQINYFSSLSLICLIALPHIVMAASVNLKWNANNEPDLSHYNVYFGKSSRNYGNPTPVKNKSVCRVDGLEKNKTYYFAITAVDTSGNESGFSTEKKAVARQVSDGSGGSSTSNNALISLTSKKLRKKAYGNIPDRDTTHLERVRYSFPGKKGSLELKYQAYDVDNTNEVKILLNGQEIGYAPVTKDNEWSTKKRTLRLNDAMVHDDKINIIEFVNTYNQSKKYSWGIKKVNVKRVKK
jgi:hypothetical protein